MRVLLHSFQQLGFSLAVCTEDNGQALIVYGASTAVGVFATQLAKRAGFFVVGVAGSSSDYAKSVGADIVVDYRGKSTEELVRFFFVPFS